MNGVRITKKIALNLSADEWEMFTHEMGCDRAAQLVNAGIEYILNTTDDRREAQRQCWKVLEQYSRYGVNDSEGHHVLERILDKFYE
jgi:predicted component of type VI protein secretion system